MSPEQAEGDLERLGPRSDVYCLGATLFCLLTGMPPFAGDAGNVILRVRRGDFRPPRVLDPTIDPALEADCLKAMSPRPEDRYRSPKALAEDIERWMADEPVTAWCEPVSRRARRWARRNRSLVTAAVLGALFLGLVASIWSARVAIQNAREAESQTRIARQEARRADDNAGLINGALGRLVERLGRDPRLKAAGLTAFRNELLHDAVEMYDELVRRNPGEGTLGLGEALNNQTLMQYLLGEIPQAIESARRAEALLAALPPTCAKPRLALATAHRQLGVVDFAAGQPTEGMKKTEEAVALYQALAREKPGDQDVRFQLAKATTNLGNFVMSSKLRRRRRPLG